MKFLTLNYWLTFYPGPLYVPLKFGLAAFLVIFLACGIFMPFIKKFFQRFVLPQFMFKSLRLTCFTCAALITVFLFFDYEGVPFFTARFWILLWIFGLVVYSYNLFKRVRKAEKKILEQASEKEYQKYLPR